jgi:hypothetical protein
LVSAPLPLERSPTNRPAAQPLPKAGVGWIFLCLAIQIACQLSLMVSWLAPARVLARSTSLGISLLLLLVVPGSVSTRHPVRAWAVGIFVILGLSALNPEGTGIVAIAAHIGFYIAVLGPLFWVARLRIDTKALTWVLVALWLFSTASAIVGVLQAYFPGRFLPSAGFLQEYGSRHNLMIRLASGASIPRPTGLTDAPGGAVAGGFYAVLLGIGVGMLRPFPLARLAAALSAIAGMTCIYLCQVRSALIMLGCCVLTVIGLFALAGRAGRSAWVAFASAAFVLLGLVFALELGGSAVMQRLETLTAQSPMTVYYSSRGRMVEGAFTEQLVEYPFGAGLGRWGMVSSYFANGERMLWAEVQWAGWVFDGGLAMLIAYPIAILIALGHSIRLALRRTTPELEVWATVIAGYNVGAIALTFSYAIFMSSGGVEFWLLNATLIQAAALFDAHPRESTPLRAPSGVPQAA